MVKNEVELIRNIILDFFSSRLMQVDKIILFGSYLRGKTNEDSDIDIIVLSDAFEGKTIFEKAKLTDGLEWILVKKIKKPFDVLYYSKKDWDNSNYLIITEAKKYGELVYS